MPGGKGEWPVESSTDWSVLGGQMGLGAVLGFAVGYTAKKALKIGFLLLGILVILGVSLQSYGFITVNWPRIEDTYVQVMEQTGDLKAFLQGAVERFGNLIPVTGSFALGFFLGLRRG